MHYTVKTKDERINIKAGQHRIDGGVLIFETVKVIGTYPVCCATSEFVSAFAPGEWEWVRLALEEEIKDTA